MRVEAAPAGRERDREKQRRRRDRKGNSKKEGGGGKCECACSSFDRTATPRKADKTKHREAPANDGFFVFLAHLNGVGPVADAESVSGGRKRKAVGGAKGEGGRGGQPDGGTKFAAHKEANH